MKILLYIAGGISIILGILSMTTIASDIQVIIVAVLIVGGINLIGIARVLGALQKRS